MGKDNNVERELVIANVARSEDWRAGRGADCGSTERVKKLNKKHQETDPGICLYRARAYTEVYKDTEAYPPIMRRAMATIKTLDTVPPFIVDGELIIGSAASKPKSQPLHPETECTWIMDEGGLSAIATRPYNPVTCTPEQAKEFEEEIYPYWKDRTIMAKWRQRTPQFLQDRTMGAGFAETAFPLTLLGSHCVLDWDMLLNNGLNSLKEIAREKLAAWDFNDPKERGKNYFYQAVIMELEAVERYARKYAAYAREAAEKENDASRKTELLKIADICDRVPHEPPRTFHEALQSMWFIYCIHHTDGTGPLLSPGRFDQYMYPFYKNDIDAGRLTRAEAQELVECFYLKLNENLLFTDVGTGSFLPGTAVFQNLQLGGMNKYGNDATNEVSYICIDALIELRTIQPNLAVRLHEGSPEKFRMKMVDLIAAGLGHPSIYNDNIAKQTLLYNGATKEEANDYVVSGCMELGRKGGYWWMPGTWINLAMAVELALNNGVRRAGMPGSLSGERVSVETGDPRSFKTYEEFERAVEKHIETQVDYLLATCTTAVDVYQDYPLVLQSVFMNSGLERGLPFHGGGVYSSSVPGTDGMGVPDIGNSLAAVKKLVYDDKLITMDELCKALDSNFEGYEDIRQMCLNAPKYGNDDDYVDLIEQRIIDFYASYTKSKTGILAKYDPDQETAKTRHTVGACLSPISGNVPFGSLTGALPSGRKAGEPLGDSCAPFMGTDLNGPTAALKSVAKLDHANLHGTITNMWINKEILKNDEGRQKLSDLVRGYFELGGGHVQFNTIEQETLRDAQAHPEKYPTLLVRVAGYSAYFVDLDKPVQDAILLRSQHTL